MLLSTDCATVSVRVAWTTPFGAMTVPSLSQDRLSHWLAFAGFQALVDMDRTAVALPVFLIQTVLEVLPPGVNAPQFKDDTLWVHALSE